MLIHDLEYLIFSIEYGSFNKAAKRLNVSPQAIWARMASLEKELGSPLLERLSSGVSPTAFGKIVYKDAQNILQIFEHWHKLGHTTSHSKIKSISLGASSSLMFSIMPVLLPLSKQRILIIEEQLCRPYSLQA
jgi:LysR family nitrogen assimilation transcriptional regulator